MSATALGICDLLTEQGEKVLENDVGQVGHTIKVSGVWEGFRPGRLPQRAVPTAQVDRISILNGGLTQVRRQALRRDHRPQPMVHVDMPTILIPDRPCPSIGMQPPTQRALA